MTELNTRMAKKTASSSRPIPKMERIQNKDYEMASLAEKKKEDLIVNLSVVFIILTCIAGGLYATYTLLPFGGL